MDDETMRDMLAIGRARSEQQWANFREHADEMAPRIEEVGEAIASLLVTARLCGFEDLSNWIGMIAGLAYEAGRIAEEMPS